MSNILIVDDHAVVRNGIRDFLAADRSIRAIGEASTGAEMLERLQESTWDVVVLDIGMPDRNGIDLLRHLRSVHPDTKVLVMSGFPERQYAVSVIRAGACGYLSKQSAPEDLLKAINAVVCGRCYVSAAVAELLVAGMDSNADDPLHSTLSPREFQILCKLAAGVTVSRIAAQLRISIKTVSTYRSRLLEKMQFKTNADLTTYALRSGLLAM